MWVVCSFSVFCEAFTNLAFGFSYILFFTFDHICEVTKQTNTQKYYEPNKYPEVRHYRYFRI